MIGDLRFAHLERIHLLWVALALVVGLGVLELRARERLGHFLSQVMQVRLAAKQRPGRRAVRLFLVLLALVFGVLALMRPQTPGEAKTITTTRASADIMVVLDVSRSMLAEDAAPNRLSRAKAEIAELVSEMEEARVGLVAFAGRATVLCPLTVDHNFFRLVLRGLDTSSVGRGGTRIGDAIKEATDAFPPGERARLMLLVTDGEDHDSYAIDAAREAKEAGIRIVTIGFGSEEGSEIAITDPDTGARSVVTDSAGNVVISRLDGELLRQIALETDGAYVPAGVAALDLGSIVEEHLEPMARQAVVESMSRVEPHEHYPWFVLGALLALVGSAWAESSGPGRALAR